MVTNAPAHLFIGLQQVRGQVWSSSMGETGWWQLVLFTHLEWSCSATYAVTPISFSIHMAVHGRPYENMNIWHWNRPTSRSIYPSAISKFSYRQQLPFNKSITFLEILCVSTGLSIPISASKKKFTSLCCRATWWSLCRSWCWSVKSVLA